MTATAQLLALLAAGNSSGPQFQCRLVYTNGTTLTLIPFNGNQIFINGANVTIPVGGITITNTGLGQNVLYYIYAFLNNGTLTLEAATTAHATNTTFGYEIKNGDSTRTLVGMAYTGNDKTPGSFFDTAAQRWVASYYNRRKRTSRSGNTTAATASTSPWVELTAFRTYFLSWSDTPVIYWWTGYNQDGYGGGHTNYTNIYIDGANQYGDSMSVAVPNSYYANHTIIISGDVSEGQHFASIAGYGNSGYTVTWYGQMYAEVTI